jgi:hypothetical protein
VSEVCGPRIPVESNGLGTVGIVVVWGEVGLVEVDGKRVLTRRYGVYMVVVVVVSVVITKAWLGGHKHVTVCSLQSKLCRVASCIRLSPSCIYYYKI